MPGRPQVLAIVAGAILIGALVWWFWPRPDEDSVKAAEGSRTLEKIQRAAARIEALMEAGKHSRAAEELGALLKAHPDTSKTVHLHGLLAGLLLKLKRADEAVEVMEKLARRMPESLDAGTKLALLYADLGRHDDAIRELKRMTAAFPDDATSPAMLGTMLALKRKEPAEGERYLRIARKRAPRDGNVAARLAEVVRLNGKTDEAILLYREAVRSTARRIPHRIELAKLLFEKFAAEVEADGKPYLREAITQLQEALRTRKKQLGPRAPAGDDILVTCYARIAELHMQLGEFGPAIGHLQWAIRSSAAPSSFLYVNLARYALAADDQAELTRALAAIDKHWPDDPQMAYAVGMLYAEAGQRAEAVEHLQRAVKGKPDFGLARYQLADLLVQEGKVNDANDQIFEALRIEPMNPQYRQLKDMIVAKINKRAGLPSLVPLTGDEDDDTEERDLLEDIMP